MSSRCVDLMIFFLHLKGFLESGIHNNNVKLRVIRLPIDYFSMSLHVKLGSVSAWKNIPHLNFFQSCYI